MIPLSTSPSEDKCSAKALTLKLRADVESALVDLIGTYTLPGEMQRKIKAIAVIKAYDNFPPEGTEVEGLEVVIFYPTPITQPLLGAYRVEWEWTIHLKQWDRYKSLHDALERILLLDGIKQTLLIPANEQLGIPQMMQILISSFVGIGT